MRINAAFLILIFVVFSLASAHAQDNWYEGIFIEGSALYCFAPKILGEYIEPKTGFRAALGYEFRRFRFAIESGFAQVEGTNPLVLNIDLYPLVFKFGYALPLVFGFGVQADVNAGFMFSKVSRYATAVDLIFDNLSEDGERSLLSGARLYLTYTPVKFIKIYAGGGADILFETDGPIPLPLIEAGLSFKPGTLIRKKEGDVTAARFETNSVYITEESLGALDEAGEKLKDNPKLRLTLRAYNAPYGTSEWQVSRGSGAPALSSARAAWCIEYLEENYGVTASRIKIEHKQAKLTEPELFRRVELIVK